MRVVLAVILVSFGATACGSDDVDHTVTVAAASSLTEAFTEIGHDFEAAHPGADIQFSFDSSSSLARQIVDGAPVDVFASADRENMQVVVDAEAANGAPVGFAANKMTIATKPGNPEQVSSLADLAGVGTVALCAVEAPCGALAAEILERARVEIPESHVTRAESVKGVVTAVGAGDADAGIVFVTDVLNADDSLEGVALPADANAVTEYQIAVVAEDDLARDFVEYVRSPRGQARLRAFGFLRS